tara:strand:- start:316 stop:639 length:324 start_codon:yes stop_codon:yes gene_type:complete
MITITKTAANKVRDLLKKEIPEKKFLRVGVRGGGCSGFSYYLEFDDKIEKLDKVITQHSIKLVIDPKSYLYLMGTELSYIDGLQEKGFKFTNPNARRTCGCGESFSI